MATKKITVGKTYPYRSRIHEGRGKVVSTDTKATGAWVTLYDKERGKNVTVRPSQVG